MSAQSTRLSRKRRAPTVGTRVAGQQSNNEDRFNGIYYGATSDFGELNGSIWFRMHDASRGGRPDAWRVSMQACGRSVYLDAVVDDFGNLVALP